MTKKSGTKTKAAPTKPLAPNQVQQARPISRRKGNPFISFLHSMIRQGILPKEDVDKFYDGNMTQEEIQAVYYKYGNQ